MVRTVLLLYNQDCSLQRELYVGYIVQVEPINPLGKYLLRSQNKGDCIDLYNHKSYPLLAIRKNAVLKYLLIRHSSTALLINECAWSLL